MEENEIKISDLLECIDPNNNDLLHIIDIKNEIDKKITVYNLLKNIPATKIKDNEIRIWNLSAGIYLLPEGCKIYYKGVTDQTYKTTNPKALLVVTEYSTDFKVFYLLSGTTSKQSIYYGYSDETTGTFDGFNLHDVALLADLEEAINGLASETYVDTKLNDYIKNSEILQKQADMTIESGTTITNGYSITLPTTYTVGRNNLELYWNGQRLIPKTSSNSDGHYQEVGTTGSSSSTITIYRTSADGNYTLTEDVHLHVVVKGKTIS